MSLNFHHHRPARGSIGDENAGCAPAPLEQGAAPCKDAVSHKPPLSDSALEEQAKRQRHEAKGTSGDRA
jgi:hypothetical protein